MFGYILPAKQRLEEREEQRFQSVYCGLCHVLGKKYGLATRFLLNYDFTFLAILLSQGQEEECKQCRCIAHPCRGRCAQQSTAALEAAADRCVVLSWWQLQDHIADSGFWKGLIYRAAALFLRRAYRKARGEVTRFDSAVQMHLQALNALEKSRCDSIDAAAEPFAALMADIAADIEDVRLRRVLEQIFYQLGRWIYLVDAADDFDSDIKSGNYNPLRYRYAVDKLGAEEKTALALTLDHSVQRMASAYALHDFGVWTPILDSIFYESLYTIGAAVLDGTYRKRRRAAQKKKKREETV